MDTGQGRGPQAPLMLDDLIFHVEVRGPRHKLEDEPVTSLRILASAILRNEFRLLPTGEMRCQHLSWDKFQQIIYRQTGQTFNAATDALGYKQVSGPSTGQEQWATVSNELTFYNAIAVMHNNAATRGATRDPVFYLFSPKPRESPFQQTWRAQAPRTIFEHRPAPLDPEPPLPESRSRAQPGEKSPGRPLSAASSPEIPLAACVYPAAPKLPVPGSDASTLPAPRVGTEGSPAPEKSAPEPPEVIELESSQELPMLDLPGSQNHPTSAAAGEVSQGHALNLGAAFLECEITHEEQQEGESDEDFHLRQQQEAALAAELLNQQLQAKLESKVCEQLDKEKWEFTCKFLHHPESQAQSEFCVHIPGLARKLLPCQAHSVVRGLLMWNSPVHGCFHAHAMGLGKTTIAITTCHIQHIFNTMYDKIAHSPQDHLPKKHSADARCPTNQEMLKSFGFDCPCATSSVTSCVKPSLGVHGIISPLGLLKNWCEEWKACYANSEKEVTKQSNPLGMRLVLGHGNRSKEDAFSIEGSRGLMEAAVDLGDPEDRVSQPTCTPRLENSRVIFLTTSNSCMKQVVGVFRREKRVGWNPEGERKKNARGEWYTTTPRERTDVIPYHALVLSSIWRDEAHKEKLASSTTLTLLGQPFFRHGQNRNYHLNPMSGTLITSGPLDIAAYLKAMVRPGWEKHPVLKKCCGDQVEELGNMWNKKVKDGSADQAVSAEVVRAIQPIIEATTIRFTPQSNFLGTGPVVTLPPNIYSEVACHHSLEWNVRLLQHRQQEDEEYNRRESKHRKEYIRVRGTDIGYKPLAKEGATFHYRSRLIASFPFLLDLPSAVGEPLRFTEAEWKERQSEWEGEREPYLKYIQEIASSSGKLQEIKKKIDEWSSKRDGEGKPPRLIFASFFLVGARIIYLWMVHILKIPKDKILFIHKVLPQKKIDEAIAQFHGDGSGKDQPQYIVATSSAFSVGLTLSEAVGIGLLEPDYTVATELQLFCRHNRLGNKNPVTYSWLFFAVDNEREDMIRRRNHIRKNIDKALEGKVVSG